MRPKCKNCQWYRGIVKRVRKTLDGKSNYHDHEIHCDYYGFIPQGLLGIKTCNGWKAKSVIYPTGGIEPKIMHGQVSK